jgi:hypothetical protein
MQSDFKEIDKKLNDLEKPKYPEYYTNWYLCNGLNDTPNLNNKNNEKLFKYIIYITESVRGIHKKNKSLI